MDQFTRQYLVTNTQDAEIDYSDVMHQMLTTSNDDYHVRGTPDSISVELYKHQIHPATVHLIDALKEIKTKGCRSEQGIAIRALNLWDKARKDS